MTKPQWPIAQKPDGTLSVVRADPSARMTGRVIKINGEKKYAFIRASRLLNGEYQDYFLHKNDMEDPLLFGALTAGDQVSFIAAGSSKGPRALQVRKED